MADLVITATSVLPGTGAIKDASKVFGEVVTAGMPVYVKPADGKLYMCQCDGNTDEVNCYGITLSGGSANQVAQVQTSGPITIGATVTVGETYMVSTAFGKICPVADLVSTNKVCYLGYGISASQIQMNVLNTGVAK